MKLENVTVSEVEEYLTTLTPDELKFYDVYSDKITATSLYIKGVWRNGVLAGIGGITCWYTLFPHCYYMIKREYQSQGIGSELADSCMRFAQDNHLKFFAGVASKKNYRSIHIITRCGYKFLWDDGAHIYSIKLFDKRWSWVQYPLKLGYIAYCSIIGRPIKYWKRVRNGNGKTPSRG